MAALPEFFIRMLTNRGDLVVDPFAGSCVTGEVAERLSRRWICVELLPQYVEGARGRFVGQTTLLSGSASRGGPDQGYYRIPHPALLWNGDGETPIPDDGGCGRRRE